MKFFKILRKYLEKFGPWATIWANGPLQFSNPKTGPGLGQNDSAQAHSGPNPKNGFTKARARPGRAWAWPELIPSLSIIVFSEKHFCVSKSPDSFYVENIQCEPTRNGFINFHILGSLTKVALSYTTSKSSLQMDI